MTNYTMGEEGEQIVGSEAESQQIVGQSLLSCLQYPVQEQSRLQGIYLGQTLYCDTANGL